MDDETKKSMKDLVAVQGTNGNWDNSDYMNGMYNGMELMLAIAEGREPQYRWKPKLTVGQRVGRVMAHLQSLIFGKESQSF